MREIALSVASVSGVHRFDGILNGNASATCDRALLDRPAWVVAPSIGAIIPGWLLVIPKRRALNFHDWMGDDLPDVRQILAELLEHLGLAPEEIIWFEHGPSAAQSVVGCGLDHAHIHVLIRPPFSFSAFEAAVRDGAPLEWKASETGVDYSVLDHPRSYLIAGSAKRVIAAMDVETAGSQFLRRVVASVVGNEGAWDYRCVPHLDNVEATVTTFRVLEASNLYG